ncbi:MAG: HEPN domain-containing protein [Candidatus Beckwithbacteria bacterium]|nr:HEPN domain-containing protein [Patescibacteria group bacterium]
MTKQQAVNYWLKSAQKSSLVAKDNFKLKHYDWCLFFWHLTLEKTLKGLIVLTDTTPPPSHDLHKLIQATKTQPNDLQLEELKVITNFNLEARYDDYKFTFYKKANQNYTKLWSKKSENIYLWLKKQY